MTARILVVDDEPDLEALIQQKFRHQIRDGAVSFLFASDGVEALEAVSKCCGVLHFVGFGSAVRKVWASSISGNSGVGEKPSSAGARTSSASMGLSDD